MGKIRILDKFVVEHIAAGEVIDRPASILKELLENAMDAGSTRVEVEVDGGGIERLAVADNGCGMDEGDAALSLQRHATSKITKLDDLESIGTYGFRGEALASVSAVSRLELTTRRRGDTQAVRITSEGGEIQQIGAAGAPEGTRIVVKDLFFNVPARRKFLKSPQTEEAACLDVLGKVALSRCDAAFQVKRNGKIAYALPAGEPLADRYMKLFPQTEASQLFPIEASHASMRLSGLIGGPLFCKSTKSGILFYVNARAVRAGVLSQAIIDGYSGYLQAGKFPVTLLFLEIDGKWVDVNFHPTKAEVRFSHPKDVYAFVEKSVAMRLAEVQEEVRRHVIPFYRDAGELSFQSDTRSASMASVAPHVSGGNGNGNGSGHGSGNGGSHATWRNAPYEQPKQRYEDLTLFEKLTPYEPEQSVPKILSCVAKTYGLFQEDETLFLVDLHNAHERINFDLLETRMREQTRPAQQLLAPVMIDLSAHQQLIVGKYGSFLRELGLEIEEFGSGSIVMRSVPLGLEQLGERKSFLSLLERLERVDDQKDPEAIQKKILISLACRSSIQAGDEVSVQEMQSLFEKLLKSSNPYFCPHGRPIIIKLTLDEVHKLFRRK